MVYTVPIAEKEGGVHGAVTYMLKGSIVKLRTGKISLEKVGHPREIGLFMAT